MLLPRVLRATWQFSAVAFLLAAPATLHAQAQATTGVIRGTVTDSTGQPLSGAMVTLRNVETNAERSLTTNDRGVYVATLLRVGTYDVSGPGAGLPARRSAGVSSDWARRWTSPSRWRRRRCSCRRSPSRPPSRRWM